MLPWSAFTSTPTREASCRGEASWTTSRSSSPAARRVTTTSSPPSTATPTAFAIGRTTVRLSPIRVRPTLTPMVKATLALRPSTPSRGSPGRTMGQAGRTAPRQGRARRSRRHSLVPAQDRSRFRARPGTTRTPLARSRCPVTAPGPRSGISPSIGTATRPTHGHCLPRSGSACIPTRTRAPSSCGGTPAVPATTCQPEHGAAPQPWAADSRS